MLLLMQLLHDKLLTLLLMPLQVDVIIGRWQIHRVTVNTSIQRFEPLNISRWLSTLHVPVLSTITVNIRVLERQTCRYISFWPNLTFWGIYGSNIKIKYPNSKGRSLAQSTPERFSWRCVSWCNRRNGEKTREIFLRLIGHSLRPFKSTDRSQILHVGTIWR